MWSQQGKYDSITASHRDLLADGPRDLPGLALCVTDEQLEDLQKQVSNLINFLFLPFVIT